VVKSLLVLCEEDLRTGCLIKREEADFQVQQFGTYDTRM